jgi:hypothetical protein
MGLFDVNPRRSSPSTAVWPQGFRARRVRARAALFAAGELRARCGQTRSGRYAHPGAHAALLRPCRAQGTARFPVRRATGAAFSFADFFWPRKRNRPACGAAPASNAFQVVRAGKMVIFRYNFAKTIGGEFMNLAYGCWLFAALLFSAMNVSADSQKPASLPSVPSVTTPSAGQSITIVCPQQISATGTYLPTGWEPVGVLLSVNRGYINKAAPGLLFCQYCNSLVIKMVDPGGCRVAPDQRSFICTARK